MNEANLHDLFKLHEFEVVECRYILSERRCFLEDQIQESIEQVSCPAMNAHGESKLKSKCTCYESMQIRTIARDR